MDWYYAQNNQPVGPLSEPDFKALIDAGRIGPGTLVWHAGLPSWLEFSQALAARPQDAPPRQGAVCAQCGRVFEQEDMIQFDGAWVCAQCKPLIMQKLKEGVRLPGRVDYAGFWIRAGAKALDWLILGAANISLYTSFGLLTGPEAGTSGWVMTIIIYLAQLLIGAAYYIFLVGKYQATLGKMACELKIVTADGGPLSYWRAGGRYAAELVSMITLYIGYLIAAFDDEKRTLHDRICYTRVVRR